ncbi:MAG: hypothetical protein HC782_03270 [Gammaproteobacteria bacterium]|nr:hypothetical protein [Gammaproteobacteria bacterium]
MLNAIYACKAQLIKAGHHLHEIALPATLADMLNTQKVIQDVESARAYGELLQSHRHQLTPALAHVLDQGAAIPEHIYQQALEDRQRAIKLSTEMMADIDAWLLPAATGEAPLGLTSTGDPLFNRLASGLGFPALSVPMPRKSHASHEMPLGLQLVGRFGQDAALLSTGLRISRTLSLVA